MNKPWIGAFFYFLNVMLSIGMFWILFTVAIPECFTTIEFISDSWSYPEGREVIIINSTLFIFNLIFALIIILLLSRSTLLAVAITLLAWASLLAVYFFGLSDIFTYAAGAVYLSIFTFKKLQVHG